MVCFLLHSFLWRNRQTTNRKPLPVRQVTEKLLASGKIIAPEGRAALIASPADSRSGKTSCSLIPWVKPFTYLKWIADSNSGLEVGQLLEIKFVVYVAALRRKKNSQHNAVLVWFTSWEDRAQTCKQITSYLHKLTKGEIHVHLRFSKKFHITTACRQTKCMALKQFFKRCACWVACNASLADIKYGIQMFLCLSLLTYFISLTSLCKILNPIWVNQHFC